MIHSFVFSDGRLVGQDLELEALRLVRSDKGLLLWVDLDGATDDEIKSVLEGVFSFHPLAIEDCVTVSSLPKVEDYDDYLFLVMHAVDFDRQEKFNSTELDLFIGRDYLVTFHRRPLRSVQAMMERCQRSTGLIGRGPDRLAHTLLDLTVDNYKPVVDELRTELEEVEQAVLEKQEESLIGDLIRVRKDVSHLRQIVRPQRDVINRLAHPEGRMIRASLLPYFRDLRDNLNRIEETAAGYADRLLVAFDLYLNRSASEANEGIKILTALTAITLPPILVGTWYGMNFEHIPELQSPYGYPAALIITLLGTAAMAFWCKSRNWI